MAAARALLGKLAFGVGMAFSASCFTALGSLYGLAQDWTPWVLLAGTVIALLVMLTVGELGGMFPSAVGVRTYPHAAFGETASLFSVLMYLLLVALVAGIECQLFSMIVELVLPQVPALPVIVGLIALLTVVNLAGWSAPDKLQNGLVALLALGLVAAMLIAAFALGGGALAQPLPAPSLGNAVEGVVLAVFLFAGIEFITVMRARGPGEARLTAIALLASVLSIALLFVLVWATLRLAGAAALHPWLPQMSIAQIAGGQTGQVLALALTAAALVTTFNAGLMGAARLIYVLGRERRLPALFAVTSQAGTPVAAVLAVAAAALLSALLVVDRGQLPQYALASATIVCVVYALFMASAARLRATQPKRGRPFRSPLPDWALWLFAVAFAALIAENLRRGLADNGSWTALAPILIAAVLAVLIRKRAPVPALAPLASSSREGR